MILTNVSSPDRLDEPHLHRLEDRDHVALWKGLLFRPGLRAGAPSVKALLDTLRFRPLDQILGEWCGTFGLFLYDKRRRRWLVASDHGGLYRIFYDGAVASTSFLELCAAGDVPVARVDLGGIEQFLLHGGIMGRGTFARGVAKLQHDEVLDLGEPEGPARLLRKRLPPVDRYDPEQVGGYFEALAGALSGQAVSVDLTGGFDSRAAACLLAREGLDFEVALSAEPTSLDAEIAAAVAGALNRPLYVTRHDLSRVEDELDALFRAGDGMADLRTFHRDLQLAAARQARGITNMVNGGAGELFKDHHALQDFPRYGRSHANLERYYATRVAPIAAPTSLFGRPARDLDRAVAARTVELLAEVRGRTNNEVYDLINFRLRSQDAFGRHFSAYTNMGLNVAGPFFEWRLSRQAIALSPWRRVFDAWHRRVITACNPEAAAVPTTDGCNASSAWRHLPGNAARVLANEARRGARKASERLLGRSLLVKRGSELHNAPGYTAALRGARRFGRALAALAALGVVRSEATPADVGDPYVGRVLTAGMFLDKITAAQERRRRAYTAVARRAEPARST